MPDPSDEQQLADKKNEPELKSFRLQLRRQPKIRRVDNFLSQHYGAYSRNFFLGLIRGRELTVNGQHVAANYRLKNGDIIEFQAPVQPDRIIQPQDIPLDILYEDAEIFVINKPPGIICHPGKNNRLDTLANAFIFHMHGMTTEKHNPGIVHRLDVDTTGAMVVAKNPDAHTYLARQFEKRLVHKKYIALVRGRIKRRFGQIDIPIGYNPRRWGLMSVADDARSVKPALSIYHVIERFKGYTLVSVVLKTGRTHQIRVHFESIAHPLIGEAYYRGGLGPDPLEELVPRLALHAWKLQITHPTTHKPMEFNAPLPDDFNTVLAHLRAQRDAARP